MPEPVTIGALTLGGLGWVWGTALPAVAGGAALGVAGSVSDRALCGLARGLMYRVGGLGGLPENHDVAKAVRTAQMQALEMSIRDYREIGRPDWRTDPATRPDMFFERSLAFCSSAVGRCRDPRVKHNLEVSEVLTAAIDGILADPPHDGPAAERADALAVFSEEAVLDELREALDGVVLPDGFEQHFRAGSGAERPRFLDLFGAQVAQQIKTNQPFYRILTVGKLSGIEALAFDIADLLAAMDRRFGAALGRIDDTTQRTEAKVDALPDEVVAKLLAALDARGETARAHEAGIERTTIFKLASRLRPDEALDFDQAVVELTAAVETAIEVAERGVRGTNYDDFVDAVLARIAEKTKSGDFDGAAQEADDGFAEWERAEAKRREASVRSGVALLEAGIEQDKLRRDPVSAARRVERIVALEHEEPGARFAALRVRQDAFYVEGRDKGVAIDLLISIEIARLSLAAARDAHERGNALNDLGASFFALGQRESGTARLEEAVAAYRSALEEWTRERVPLDWAATQNNLGAALRALGARESGTARLEEAVAAYRAALEEGTRERVPRDWGMTQNNLGNALQTLGDREGGAVRLEEAVAAYCAALEERTRERVPLDWAATQNNLGAALRTLGARESGTARLEEAVAAYRAALEERSRERVPFLWAQTQENLAIAFLALFERTEERSHLDAALAAVDGALEEFRKAGAEFYIEKAERLRADILSRMT